MVNTIPKIINAGIYDATVIHKNRAETKKRRVSVLEIELPFVTGGIAYIDQNQYNISPNHIICAKPGQIRHTRFPFKCSFIHLMFEDTFSKQLLSSFPDQIDISNNINKYICLFSEIIRTFNFPSKNYELYLGSKTLQLLYMLSLETTSDEYPSENDNNIIARSIAYMDEHFTEKITLKDIANSVCLSPIYFHQMFSQAMCKKTPSDYILNKRIDLAKKLLVSSPKSLSEIAFFCGFSSQSYFGQVFKQKTNMTPYEYRKINYSRYPEK